MKKHSNRGAASSNGGVMLSSGGMSAFYLGDNWLVAEIHWILSGWATEFSGILYMGHGPGSMDGDRILWNSGHGAWARVYGWLQNSLEFCT